MDMQEKHRSVASCTPPAADLACNPSMCPDRESSQQPFSHRFITQPTKPQQTMPCVHLNAVFSLLLVRMSTTIFCFVAHLFSEVILILFSQIQTPNLES